MSKKRTLLSSLSSRSLDDAQKTTNAMAKSVSGENHKQKKATCIPENLMQGLPLAVKVFPDLHTALKIHAATTKSDIQTKANEAIYKLLLAEGVEIKPSVE